MEDDPDGGVGGGWEGFGFGLDVGWVINEPL